MISSSSHALPPLDTRKSSTSIPASSGGPKSAPSHTSTHNKEQQHQSGNTTQQSNNTATDPSGSSRPVFPKRESSIPLPTIGNQPFSAASLSNITNGTTGNTSISLSNEHNRNDLSIDPGLTSFDPTRPGGLSTLHHSSITAPQGQTGFGIDFSSIMPSSVMPSHNQQQSQQQQQQQQRQRSQHQQAQNQVQQQQRQQSRQQSSSQQPQSASANPVSGNLRVQ